MGKHSKPREPLIPRVFSGSRAPLVGAALVPVVGALTAAAGNHHSIVAEQTAERAPLPAEESAAAPAAHEKAAQETAAQKAKAAAQPLAVTMPAKQALAPTPPPPPPPAPLPVSVSDGDVPQIAFQAYRHAADTIARTQPTCGIPWTLIAGIGRVESHHANQGDATADGTLKDPIYGPTLDGSLAGNQVITDTDGGRLDGDAVHDRAVGPMQFIPSTWEQYAADGNGDGKADPQNLFDAALTTARYLCDGHLDLRNQASETEAVLRYNNSMEYVSNVLGFARSY